MKNFLPAYKDYLDPILLEIVNVRPGLMFGCPGYYTSGGLAVCHYNDHFFIKLPAEKVSELLAHDPNASATGPMGPKRSMGKNWVFLHVKDMAALKTYTPLFLQSVAFVEKEPRKAKTKAKRKLSSLRP